MDDDIYPNAEEADHILAQYSYTSQQDEIIAKAKFPSMYSITATVNSAIEDDAKPTVWVERIGKDKATYEFQHIPNEQTLNIILTILPRVVELYLAKAKDYGGTSGGLGPRAPFVDIWRKVIKLKRSLWEGEELQFEQPEELLFDLIGTSLNILCEMDSEVRQSSPS